MAAKSCVSQGTEQWDELPGMLWQCEPAQAVGVGAAQHGAGGTGGQAAASLGHCPGAVSDPSPGNTGESLGAALMCPSVCAR